MAVLLLAGFGLAGWGHGTVARTIGVVVVMLAVVYQQFCHRLVKAYAAEEKRREACADQPWLWRKEWSGPAIQSEDAKGLGMIWFFAVVWNGISLPAVYGVFTERHPDKAAYLVCLFPLVGLGLLATAVYKTAQRRKYGRTQFVPTELPGVIGGYLGGVIEVPARVVLEKDARVALHCVRRVVTGSGKNRRTVETVLWQREERIPPGKWLSVAGRTDIPVLFRIPAGSTPSDPESGDNEVLWRLTAEAETPGVDFKTQFNVPVFDTGEAMPEDVAGGPLLNAYREQEPAAGLDWAGAGIERRVDGYRFNARHLNGARLVFTLILVVMLGLLGVFWVNAVPWVAWVIVGIVAGVMLLMSGDLWWANYELQILGDEVVVRKPRQWGTREWRVSRAEVDAVRKEQSISIGQRFYFRLVLVGTAGADVQTPVAGESFQARKLRYQLRKRSEAGADTRDLLTALSGVPRFEIICAGHVPGPAVADTVAAEILAVIKGKPEKI